MSTDARGGSAPFGARCTPHMLVQRHLEGGWQRAAIRPFGPLELSPLARCLHYGQSVFEGMKAYRTADGSIALFRPRTHLERLNRSAERLCIPRVDPEALLRSIVELVQLDAAHTPAPPDALYVRPIVFADEAALPPGIAASYLLLVLLAPVGNYFPPEGIRLRTETRFVRAAPGGTGAAKCAGNYSGSYLAQQQARAAGFDEVLWLDARERRFVEETGSMNLMIVRDGTLTTPPCSDTILEGVTRDSLLALARELEIPSEERRLAVDPADWRGVTEVFSSGTAAGTTHVREIVHENEVLFRRAEPGPIARRLGAALDEARFGAPDARGWRVPCVRSLARAGSAQAAPVGDSPAG